MPSCRLFLSYAVVNWLLRVDRRPLGHWPKTVFGEISPSLPHSDIWPVTPESDQCREARNPFGVPTTLRQQVQKLTAHMTLVIGCIHLNQESIWIPELKRFLIPSGLRLQIGP